MTSVAWLHFLFTWPAAEVAVELQSELASPSAVVMKGVTLQALRRQPEGDWRRVADTRTKLPRVNKAHILYAFASSPAIASAGQEDPAGPGPAATSWVLWVSHSTFFPPGKSSTGVPCFATSTSNT